MDETDRRLLKALGGELQPSCRELAGRLGISSSAVHKRLRSLESKGILGRVSLVPSPRFFDALEVMIFGRSTAPSMESALKLLGRSPCTSRVIAAGGNELFVHAVIPDLSGLDRYAEFVRREARMPDAQVGILRPSPREQRSSEGLSRLDYRILRALRDDLRLRPAELAGSLGVSPKTVARRLRGLLAQGAAAPLLALHPERTGDALAVLRLRLREGRRPAGSEEQSGNEHPNVFVSVSFTNLPEWRLLLLWGSDLAEILKVQQKLEAPVRVESGVLNFVWLVRDYHTWLDKTISRRAELDAVVPALRRRRRHGRIGELDVVTRLDTYRSALTQALEDGVITDDEEAILRALRDSLGITDEDHQQMVKLLRAQKRA